MDESIANALVSFKSQTEELGYTIIKSPVATAQPSLLNPSEVEITVRALVK